MSTTYSNRPIRTTNRRHLALNTAHISAHALRKGREVIEEDVADFLLGGLNRATYLPRNLAETIEIFMRLSRITGGQHPAYLKFLRALLSAYGPQSPARTCDAPMQFMTSWAEYLLDPECPDTKTSDDQVEALLRLWRIGGTLIEEDQNLGSLNRTVDQLTAAMNSLERSCSQVQQSGLPASGGLWGNIDGHWTNTRAQ